MGGRQEVVLEDRTRVDCLTFMYAIEFDFADKWAEAIGQALHYGQMKQRRAMIWLIVEKESDVKYYHRAHSVITKGLLPIDLRCTGDACPNKR